MSLQMSGGIIGGTSNVGQGTFDAVRAAANCSNKMTYSFRPHAACPAVNASRRDSAFAALWLTDAAY